MKFENFWVGRHRSEEMDEWVFEDLREATLFAKRL